MIWNATTAKGYAALFARARVTRQAAARAAAERILAKRTEYASVQARTGVPWWFIGLLHMRESGQDFSTYLGNGQRLAHKTTLVPAGRGPFATFEDGAVDALTIQGFTKVADWSVPHALYLAEAFNGFGYVSRGVNSPYIWAGTDQYSAGKFVADGHFSTTAVDAQLGVACVLKNLMISSPQDFSRSELLGVDRNNKEAAMSVNSNATAGVNVSTTSLVTGLLGTVMSTLVGVGVPVVQSLSGGANIVGIATAVFGLLSAAAHVWNLLSHNSAASANTMALVDGLQSQLSGGTAAKE